ncbi:hypothetical protein ANN_03073 [Periplaneta americana]|uniref:Uncharacterized protein n=1 Tax=Periplaneta americana TaxID=6978 RepID=A0ABQ8TY06_PERAM|nr:hypothetical protein ANN_03073 [Periplaneta americana]
MQSRLQADRNLDLVLVAPGIKLISKSDLTIPGTPIFLDALQDIAEQKLLRLKTLLDRKTSYRSKLLNTNKVVVITEDVQNVHLPLEYRPHIDVSLTCEHDPKHQEYCVCPQNMPQFDSEGIPNQAPETNKPMILNGPTSRNRESSDQVSVEAKQLGHLYLSIDQETFDPNTGEPYD